MALTAGPLDTNSCPCIYCYNSFTEKQGLPLFRSEDSASTVPGPPGEAVRHVGGVQRKPNIG